MEKYYCKVKIRNDSWPHITGYTNYFRTVNQAEEAARCEAKRDDVAYVEYGVCKFNGWFGDSILAVVKPGVPYEFSDEV